MTKKKYFSALIIDDDPTSRSILEAFLEADGRAEVFASLDSAVHAVETIEKWKPDVIFLDINMPHEDGLRFASRLKETGNNSLLVFCTAFDSYALEAFELKPFDFLTKPFGCSDLSMVADRIIAEYNDRREDDNKAWSLEVRGKLKFKTLNGFYFAKPSEILFVRSMGNNCELITILGVGIRILVTLSEAYNYLGKKQFVKINRSSILNIDYIYSVERKNRRCLVKCDDVQHEFIISAQNISELEDIILLRLG
jgi:DNA-binding LytR/AlgR family response regulator